MNTKASVPASGAAKYTAPWPARFLPLVAQPAMAPYVVWGFSLCGFTRYLSRESKDRQFFVSQT
jgi:hypothetical protein